VKDPLETNTLDAAALNTKSIQELGDIARRINIPRFRTLKKQELIDRILQGQADQYGAIYAQGVLEVLPEGYGFMRVKGYLPSPEDVYISQQQIRRYFLTSGSTLTAQVRPPKESEKYYSLVRVEAVNGTTPEIAASVTSFDDLVPIYPQEQLHLETHQANISARLIDIFSPIGKGQRGLIVSPPKAGKTTLLKAIANSVTANHPEVYLIALLIDERPEEVTDFQRSVKGEVVYSTFDELPDNHVRVAELVMEKAKRLVEMGRDVVILLDSITRMGRAYNLTIPPSGRTSPAVSIPTPCTGRSGSSAPPGTSRAAAR